MIHIDSENREWELLAVRGSYAYYRRKDVPQAVIGIDCNSMWLKPGWYMEDGKMVRDTEVKDIYNVTPCELQELSYWTDGEHVFQVTSVRHMVTHLSENGVGHSPFAFFMDGTFVPAEPENVPVKEGDRFLDESPITVVSITSENIVFFAAFKENGWQIYTLSKKSFVERYVLGKVRL